MRQSRTVLRYDELQVVIHPDSRALAEAAAAQASEVIAKALHDEGRAAIVLATGNSQLEFLDRLCAADLDWSKVSILHMDEYVGIPEEHPASFRRYLLEHVVERLSPGPAAFHGLRGDADDLEAEMGRYEALVGQERPCLCALGIGENGHLAFNDPPADLSTSTVVRQVTLDRACRQQQVGEGYFPDLESVPRRALTLTVPTLLATPHVVGVVPERRKALAVKAALEGPLTPDCPASALRRAGNAVLHLDPDSASALERTEPGA